MLVHTRELLAVPVGLHVLDDLTQWRVGRAYLMTANALLVGGTCARSFRLIRMTGLSVSRSPPTHGSACA